MGQWIMNTVEDKVTLCMKTFERPKSAQKLVNSIRKYYPNIRIIVADDSKDPVEIIGADHIIMPYYSGSSAGRNLAMQQVDTEYMVTLDDDFFFSRQTDLKIWMDILDKTDIDIVSGNVEARRFEGLITLDNGECRLIQGNRGKCGELNLYDVVLQFWMGKTEKIQQVGGWDDDFKTQDHKIFFCRHINKLKIAHCSKVFVHHPRHMPPAYINFRHGQKEQDFLKMMMDKLNVDMIEEFGTITAKR